VETPDGGPEALIEQAREALSGLRDIAWESERVDPAVPRVEQP
jgi:hypothetical protein